MKHWWYSLLSMPMLLSFQPKTADFHWLEGTWVMKKDNRIYSESWEKRPDGQLSAHSVMKLSKKVLWSESCRIAQQNGVWYYFSKVSNQQKQGEISFKLIQAGPDVWTFENPNHDFPTRISYQRKGTDSLLALVTGIQNGRPDTLRFPMRRSKP